MFKTSVGIDVHKKMSYATVVNPEDEKIVEEKSMRTPKEQKDGQEYKYRSFHR